VAGAYSSSPQLCGFGNLFLEKMSGGDFVSTKLSVRDLHSGVRRRDWRQLIGRKLSYTTAE
jgi:hypothetical protein